MSMNNPYQKYQQQSILTANGPTLLVKLFERIIRACKELEILFAQEQLNIEEINNNCLKIQEILTHLIATLDRSTPDATKVSDELEPLYYTYYNFSVEINIKKDPKHLPAILQFAQEWREVWMKVQRNAG